MFQISHETPIQLLEDSKSYNDYDYALVHLFEKKHNSMNSEYYNFFKDQVRAGRRVILDNSAYELGAPFNVEKYFNWILLLRPSEFILPDYRDDRYGNIQAVDKWNFEYGDLPEGYNPVKIGVVHGETYEEYCKCYRFLLSRVDKIAFSFESFFKDWAEYNQVSLSISRIQILQKMVAEGVINPDKPHHILGALSPWEYSSYLEYDWVETVDTSSPVLHGLIGDSLESLSMTPIPYVKPVEKLEEFITASISDSSRMLILDNVDYFKKYLERSKRPKLTHLLATSELASSSDKEDFDKITNSIADLLKYKNEKYGNAALDPLEVFKGKTTVGQRLDDKLARVKNSEELRKNDVADIIGYLVLACREKGWMDFSEFKD